jgi:hypothetical protein
MPRKAMAADPKPPIHKFNFLTLNKLWLGAEPK